MGAADVVSDVRRAAGDSAPRTVLAVASAAQAERRLVRPRSVGVPSRS